VSDNAIGSQPKGTAKPLPNEKIWLNLQHNKIQTARE